MDDDILENPSQLTPDLPMEPIITAALIEKLIKQSIEFKRKKETYSTVQEAIEASNNAQDNNGLYVDFKKVMNNDN